MSHGRGKPNLMKNSWLAFFASMVCPTILFAESIAANSTIEIPGRCEIFVSEAYLAEPKIEAVLLMPAETHKALFELTRNEKLTLAELEAGIKAAKTFEEKRAFKEAKKAKNFEFQAERLAMLEKSLSGAQLGLIETINLTAKKAVEDADVQSGWSGMLPSDPTRAETEKKRKVLYKALFQEELEKLLPEDAKAALKNSRISKE